MTNEPRASDPFDLQRFVDAQDPVIASVRAELDAGRKRSHWMWFVFPQRAGLGHSVMAQRYAIGSDAEALAYWQHPVLGPRLADCTRLVLAAAQTAPHATAHEIFGSPDDLKFVSSMQLFSAVAADEPAFAQALRRFAPTGR